MSVVQKGFRKAIQDIFCTETIRWCSNKEQTSFSRYIRKNGVFHLLEQGRKNEAVTFYNEFVFYEIFSEFLGYLC